MGTCKLRAGDRRESVIGYRSLGAKASSDGDGLSNYPARRPAAGQGQPGVPRQPTPPAPGKDAPGDRRAGGKTPGAMPGAGMGQP